MGLVWEIAALETDDCKHFHSAVEVKRTPPNKVESQRDERDVGSVVEALFRSAAFKV